MTPTAVDFGVVVAASAAALAPRVLAWTVAVVLGISTLLGGAQAIGALVGLRKRLPDSEPPHWSDIWLYGVIPTAIYLGLAVTTLALFAMASWAVTLMAALLLALLLLGIRNAWDLVTFLAPRKKDGPP